MPPISYCAAVFGKNDRVGDTADGPAGERSIESGDIRDVPRGGAQEPRSARPVCNVAPVGIGAGTAAPSPGGGQGVGVEPEEGDERQECEAGSYT